MHTVLLVEDNPDNRDLVFAFLDDLYSIVACVDGFEALAYLRDSASTLPSLILCDISLPGMDGVELLRTLRLESHLIRIPAIALTSHAMKGDAERFLAAGFEAYISKPVMDDSQLIGPIELLLGTQ